MIFMILDAVDFFAPNFTMTMGKLQRPYLPGVCDHHRCLPTWRVLISLMQIMAMRLTSEESVQPKVSPSPSLLMGAWPDPLWALSEDAAEGFRAFGSLRPQSKSGECRLFKAMA